MNKKTYLAVLEKAGSGTYGVYFPDFPGCISTGDRIDDTIENAKEALELHYYGMFKDGDPIPEPSKELSKEDEDAGLVCSVTIYPELVIERFNNKKVKTNCVLPAWLKEIAEENRINYSQVLESALRQKLGLG